MPKFYHIHRGLDESTLDKEFLDVGNGCQGLFFAKKDTMWHNIERETSVEYGGYKEYEIYIPSFLYTLSLTPTTPKVIKITEKNVSKYLESLRSKKYCRGIDRYNPNIIGVDVTIKDLRIKKFGIIYNEEGVIFRWNPNIKIHLCNKVSIN